MPEQRGFLAGAEGGFAQLQEIHRVEQGFHVAFDFHQARQVGLGRAYKVTMQDEITDYGRIVKSGGANGIPRARHPGAIPQPEGGPAPVTTHQDVKDRPGVMRGGFTDGRR